jgi:hypothetical protein
MILYEKLYEREGSDCWIIDFVQIQCNELGLFLEHKYRVNSNRGNVNRDNTTELNNSELDIAQKQIDNYLEENGIISYFTINLKKLME